MTKKDDLGKMMKDKYEELEKQESELKKLMADIASQKKPLKAYLYETGDLERPTRAKRKPPSTELKAVNQ